MSTMTIGVAALLNANLALTTTSHNVANVNTVGYRRQEAVFVNNLPWLTGSGFIGQGARIVTVRQSYDAFLERQLFDVDGKSAYMDKSAQALAQIDAILGDHSAGLPAALQNFFAAWESLADSPASPAVRQGVLSAAQGLANMMNVQGGYLGSLQDGVNVEIGNLVERINALARQVAELNQRIGDMQGATGQPANDLIDQRDAALAELNRLAGVSVVKNSTSDYSVFLGTQALVLNDTALSLAAKAGPFDPSRIEVWAGNTPLTEPGRIGGELGALIDYRRQQLDPAQASLGRIALALAQQVNKQHQMGKDLAGNLGGLFFADPTNYPQSFAHTSNTGTGVLTVALGSAPNDSSKLTTSDYELSFNGAQYTLRRLSDGQSWSNASLTTLAATAAQGFTLSMSGTTAAGDRFLIRPTAAASQNFAVALSDPAKIAAADGSAPPGAILNNQNALALAALRINQTVIAGGNTFESAYAAWVSSVGQATASAQAQQRVYANMLQQAKAAQQSVSGVNLDEEAANMLRYQHYYQAAAQLIKTSNTLFETILNL
jgi:flagellar hook-associated protein 1 FlgK